MRKKEKKKERKKAGRALIFKTLSLVVVAIFTFNTFALAQPITVSQLNENTVIYEKVIYEDDQITIVESLYLSNTLPSMRSIFNTVEYTKTKTITISSTGQLVAKAHLTARFIYDDPQQVISCSSATDSYYVASGNSNYFRNKQITYSSSSGSIFSKPSQTATLSYAYGIAGATGSISITCNTAGVVS